ncbi:hypothetical protein Emin_0195 [Elusimicrobium minutum Pei191]|uniref:Uncharacterized protein n=1 Tax=Elusimicrobium minutum (strain Pei191) TaxID=445932 RepID=B2KBS2_ELUMP|nr:hypothetical protein [Elusimicrobium minutum]ACC97759.1 hypothetical protein Emin_0195 [Elusimicrobium minutum Pei191]
MTKKSYFFITIIVACIAVLIAYRGYGIYQRHVERINAQQENEMPSMFGSISAETPESEPPQSGVALYVPPSEVKTPLDTTHSQMPPSRHQVKPNIQSGVMPPSANDFPLDPVPELPQVSTNAEVQKKAENVFKKYSENPLIKQFNQDMQKAGAYNMDFAKLAGQDINQVLSANPQLQQVFMKYAQNPEFLKLIQQLQTDPEVKQVTQQLRQQN